MGVKLPLLLCSPGNYAAIQKPKARFSLYGNQYAHQENGNEFIWRASITGNTKCNILTAFELEVQVRGDVEFYDVYPQEDQKDERISCGVTGSAIPYIEYSRPLHTTMFDERHYKCKSYPAPGVSATTCLLYQLGNKTFWEIGYNENFIIEGKFTIDIPPDFQCDDLELSPRWRVFFDVIRDKKFAKPLGKAVPFFNFGNLILELI